MTDFTTRTLLKDIRDIEATDIHRTAGKAPVVTDVFWEFLRPLADDGLIVMDASEAPLMSGKDGVLVGRGFVSLTEAGRAALVQN
jgi:hypothetical protein